MSSSGFCVGGIPFQILPCSFQLCAQGAHYSCLPLYSSPTSVISHVISGCPPLLPLAVQWLHFSRLVFKGVFPPPRLFLFLLSLSLPYFFDMLADFYFPTLSRLPESQCSPYQIAPLSPGGIFNRILRAAHQ